MYLFTGKLRFHHVLLYLLFFGRLQIVVPGATDFAINNDIKLNLNFNKFSKIGIKGIVRVMPLVTMPKNYVSCAAKINRDVLEYTDNILNEDATRFLTLACNKISSADVNVALKKCVLPTLYLEFCCLENVRNFLEKFPSARVILDVNLPWNIVHSRVPNYKKDIIFEILRIYKIVFNFFLFLFNPKLLKELFNFKLFRFKKNTSELIDLAMDLTWGVAGQNLDKGIKKTDRDLTDDLLIRNMSFNPVSANTKFGLVASRWVFKDDQVRIIKDYCLKNNLKFMNFATHSLTWLEIIQQIKRNLSLIFKREFWCYISVYDAKYIAKISHNYAKQMSFISLTNIKNYFSRDDYDYEHVLRTGILEHNGGSNFGLQHSAFCDMNIIPQHAYTRFSTYFTCSEPVVEIWSKYWKKNNQNIINVGPHRSFLITNAKSDTARLNHFNAKYKNKINVVFLCSKADYGNSPFDLLKYKYSEIHKVCDISKDIHLIIRGRDKGAVATLLSICPEIKQYVNMGRASIELDDFTSQELAAFADIIIAEDTSSIILEALINKDIFIFSIPVRLNHFSPLAGILCESVDDLCNRISLLKYKRSFACQQRKYLDQLRCDHETFNHPNCWSEMAKVISTHLAVDK